MKTVIEWRDGRPQEDGRYLVMVKPGYVVDLFCLDGRLSVIPGGDPVDNMEDHFVRHAPWPQFVEFEEVSEAVFASTEADNAFSWKLAAVVSYDYYRAGALVLRKTINPDGSFTFLKNKLFAQ